MKLIKYSVLLIASATLLTPALASAQLCQALQGQLPSSIIAGAGSGCPPAPSGSAPAGSQYVYSRAPGGQQGGQGTQAGQGSWVIQPTPAPNVCPYLQGSQPPAIADTRCPPVPSVAAPLGQQYSYSTFPAPSGSWIVTPKVGGSYTVNNYPQPGQQPPGQPQPKGHTPKALDSANTMSICLFQDGTWSSIDGSIVGGWTAVGNEISLSGNSDAIGDSAVLNVLEPGVSMTGSLQQWPVTDPTADQTVYSTIWTVNSPSCN